MNITFIISLLLLLLLLPITLDYKDRGREIISIYDGDRKIISVVQIYETIYVSGDKETVVWLYESWQAECWPGFRRSELWEQFEPFHIETIKSIRENGVVEIYNGESRENKKILFRILNNNCI